MLYRAIFSLKGVRRAPNGASIKIRQRLYKNGFQKTNDGMARALVSFIAAEMLGPISISLQDTVLAA